MNFNILMIYILDEIVQRLRKYIKRKINLSEIKLFNKKKMLLFATIRLLLKIETFNYLIIACELLDLRYDLILKQNWLKYYNLNINWRTLMMRIINIKHKMHILLSSNLKQYINNDKSENLNLISNN